MGCFRLEGALLRGLCLSRCLNAVIEEPINVVKKRIQAEGSASAKTPSGEHS